MAPRRKALQAFTQQKTRLEEFYKSSVAPLRHIHYNVLHLPEHPVGLQPLPTLPPLLKGLHALLLLPSSATKSCEQPSSNSVVIHISKIAKLFTAAVLSRLRGRNTCKLSYSFICIIRRLLNICINANWVCITCSSFSEKKRQLSRLNV